MKAVIYARYSSDSQREESIEGQLRECLEFANKIGVDVVANYIDRAMTATSDNRPDFQRMIKDSYKHCFLTKEQIRFGIEKFKKLNISTKEGKQRLIDGFINAIYLYDDKITFTFNYKDGTKTVFLSELNCTPSGSDLKCLGAPNKNKTNLDENSKFVLFFTSDYFGLNLYGFLPTAQVFEKSTYAFYKLTLLIAVAI